MTGDGSDQWCGDCGALIFDRTVHDRWHDRLQPLLDAVEAERLDPTF